MSQNNEIIKKAEADWNARADAYNQWAALGMDEKLELVASAAIAAQATANPDLAHVLETLHDHGNGKYQGEVSKAQRDKAVRIVEGLAAQAGQSEPAPVRQPISDFDAVDSFMTEPHTDDKAVERFAESMKRKLAQKRNEGKSGWQDRSWTPEQISQALCEHVAKGDPTDVANYCMFLAARGEPIVTLPTHQSLVTPEADMFWDDSDRERQHNSIEDFLNEEMCAGFDVQIGTEFTLLCASSLPNVRIRVTTVDDEACEAEYEVIDAAINPTGGTT